MTILQPMFDSMRRYRKMQGRQMLYIIREFLSDGRLIRIVGKDQEQYVPLTKQEGADKYDIIVDDAPSSPNQKEATWAMLQQILPAIGKIIPPSTWMALLEFSPLPSSAQAKIKESMEGPKGPDGQPLPPPPDPEVEKMKAMMQLEQQKAQSDQQLKAQAQEFELHLEMQKAEREAQIAQFRAATEMQIKREQAEADRQLAREKAQQDAEIRAFTAKAQAENAANKPAPTQ
jgi:hypothetical protein